MKITTLLFRATAMALAGALLASCSRSGESPAESAMAGGEALPVQRSQNGEPGLVLDEATQNRLGLKTETAGAVTVPREVKGYGRVLDPAPLAALVNDLATARAAAAASKREYDRLKALSAQNNASARALEVAEASARRDELLVDSARDRLSITWGNAMAERSDLPALVQSLVSREDALVRVDLPPGEPLSSPPVGARLVTLSDEQTPADYVGPAGSVDPRTQSRGFLFLAGTNVVRLAPGVAVTGYLRVGGEPINGFSVPRPAVIRHEGATWIYLQRAGTNFVRRTVVLEQPVGNGWLVRTGLNAGDRIVTSGAQTLLSEELNRSGFLSGERD